jgi:hypothetical protein
MKKVAELYRQQHAKNHTPEHMQAMDQAMAEGQDFGEAHDTAMSQVGAGDDDIDKYMSGGSYWNSNKHFVQLAYARAGCRRGTGARHDPLSGPTHGFRRPGPIGSASLIGPGPRRWSNQTARACSCFTTGMVAGRGGAAVGATIARRAGGARARPCTQKAPIDLPRTGYRGHASEVRPAWPGSWVCAAPPCTLSRRPI